MDVHIRTTLDGTVGVSWPKSAFQDLVDAQDDTVAMRDVAMGVPGLSWAAFGRFSIGRVTLGILAQVGGVTQTALAQQAGITWALLAETDLDYRH